PFASSKIARLARLSRRRHAAIERSMSAKYDVNARERRPVTLARSGLLRADRGDRLRRTALPAQVRIAAFRGLGLHRITADVVALEHRRIGMPGDRHRDRFARPRGDQVRHRAVPRIVEHDAARAAVGNLQERAGALQLRAHRPEGLAVRVEEVVAVRQAICPDALDDLELLANEDDGVWLPVLRLVA